MRNQSPWFDLRAALALSALSITARAQCPTWQEGFNLPGIIGTVAAMETFVDVGGSPVLVLGGFQLEVPGLPVLGAPVLVWNGSTLTALGQLNRDTSIQDFAVWDDGSGPSLYAAGFFNDAPIRGVGRWDGNAWQPLANGILGTVEDLEVFDDGTGSALYATGNFTNAGGVAVLYVARWNGTAWSAVGNGTTDGPNNHMHALAVFDDGQGPALYAGGRLSGVGSTPASLIAKWDGATWSAVGLGLASGRVYSLCAYDDGSGSKLYAGGTFATDGVGQPMRGLARFDGTSWSRVGTTGLVAAPGSSVDVPALRVGDLGTGPRLYATGRFTTADGVLVNNLLAWDGSQFHALGSGASGASLGFYDDGSGNALYVGGSFATAGGIVANGVARFDGATWSTIQAGQGLSGPVEATAVHDDGTGVALYAGGSFSAAGSTFVRNIARWDGNAWSPLGTGASSIVFALQSHDDGSGPALYAGGTFFEIGGVSTAGIARWDGAAWSAVGGGITVPLGGSVTSMAVFDDGTGAHLYVAGDFHRIGGVTAYNIAKWDGTTWSPLGLGLGDYADALAVHDDGTGPALYAGGVFTTADLIPAARLARWDGSAWSAVGGGVSGGFTPTVFALHSHDDGSGRKLYVGGRFATAGVPGTGAIARWNGMAFESLGGITTANHGVEAFATFDEGRGDGPALFAAGLFSSIGTQTQLDGIARWNGAAWSDLDGGVSAKALQVFDAGLGNGPALFVGGSLKYAGTMYSRGIAAWSSCGETGRSLCFGDGSGTACPCGNASAIGDREGCVNSTGFGGRLRASGNPSLANDTLVLSGTRMTNGTALYFQGTSAVNGGNGTVFGDGLRCAGGSIVRLAILPNVGGASSFPGVGDAPLSSAGAVGQPGKRTYQTWFRDAAAFCTPSVFNLTNALEIDWTN